MKKQYKHKKVTFGSVGPKWSFTAKGFEYRTPLPGGKETATKVAIIVAGALVRTKGKGLDNLGRHHISNIVEKAKQTI